jgi:DNA (cytosine-5)-methyltransferase 1
MSVAVPYLMADFFSGAGGLSLGLTNAGFQPVFAFDADPYACETYRRNLGGHVTQTDALALSARVICEKVRIKPGDLTLVCGGPPCQGFSTQRRGMPQDSRNDLVISFATLAADLNPAVILIENVPGLLGERGRDYIHKVAQALEKRGYQHTSRILDAADYGVPQHRLRAFILAWQPTRAAAFSFPRPTHTGTSWLTVRDAIGDLPEPPDDYTEHLRFANHVRVRISPRNELRIAHVPIGGSRIDLPPELQLPCHRNANGHRHLDVYGRLFWDRPAATITAMFDNFTRGRFAHPDRNRSITAREGARLQTFPDTFRFYGPKKDVARQIGNAVPPRLAEQIGSAIISALERREDVSASPAQLRLGTF